MFTVPPVVPELDVADLSRSVNFYLDALGFSVRFERPEERFAYLTRGPVHLMLEQADGPGRRYRIAPLEYPFGRGMNLQIQVPDVDRLHAQALRAGATIDIPLEERWYRQGDEEAGNRQFVVVDLDGYLLRFFSSLGRRNMHSQPRPGDVHNRSRESGFGRSLAEGFKSLAATHPCIGLVWAFKLGQVFPWDSAVICERWSRG
jgi:catechol 2,3-dioxygenase-like lactoylglutathione lyase family enzyme